MSTFNIHSFTKRLLVYYRLYTKDGAIESYNHIYSNDRFMGRILTKAVAPPHTVSSLKRYLCEIEGFPGAENSDLYVTLLSQCAVMLDSTRISLLGPSGIGSSMDDPVALVIGDKDSEKRAGNTDIPKDLPQTPDATDTRHGTFDNLICSRMSSCLSSLLPRL